MVVLHTVGTHKKKKNNILEMVWEMDFPLWETTMPRYNNTLKNRAKCVTLSLADIKKQ